MAWDLQEFIDDMARHAAPASGSAAAYALAMSAALAEKVIARSPRLGEAAAKNASGLVSALRQEALELVEGDRRAVLEMLAEGAPGAAAIEVPRRIAEIAGELIELARMLEERGNDWLLADSTAARELATAARATCEAILASNEG